MNVLTIDVGGTHVKLLATGQAAARKFASGPTLTAQQMVDKALALVQDWDYDAVSIGYPGPVVHGQILREPHNLGRGWMGYDFAGHFGKPVQVINDAAMQALGSYEGGRMLFIGLGTGLGTALVIEKVVAPLELAHLPYRKGRTYEDYLGVRGLERFGKQRWRAAVAEVVELFRAALVVDYVVLGVGNVKKLTDLPAGARLGNNRNAFAGGFRLWDGHQQG
jgi:polyphosphate glucokinase